MKRKVLRIIHAGVPFPSGISGILMAICNPMAKNPAVRDQRQVTCKKCLALLTKERITR